MQITGGSARGIPLKSPKNTVRPSQNQVRLAIFSILESNYLPERGYQNMRGADVFAGTGALGIEILSRGAAHVDFIEKDKSHSEYIRQNLEKAKLLQRASIITANASVYFQKERTFSYDIIFLDPPYDQFDTIDLKLYVQQLIFDGILVYLFKANNTPQPFIRDAKDRNWQRSDIRTYGTTGLCFYTNEHSNV